MQAHSKKVAFCERGRRPRGKQPCPLPDPGCPASRPVCAVAVVALANQAPVRDVARPKGA